MSNPTPPGWYPVPGTAEERWWDGTQWTADVRPAGRLADAPTQAWDGTGLATPNQPNQHPPYPGYQPQPPAAPARRNRLVVGVAAAAGGVIALGIIAALVLAPGPGPDPTPSPTRTLALPGSPTPGASRSAVASPSPSRSTAKPAPSSSALGGTVMLDVVHSWRVPVPADWSRETPGSNITVYADSGQYDCQMAQPCVRAQFAVEIAPVTATDAKSAAEAAMAVYAPRVFGDLASHEALTPGTTRVAGLTGYSVRWYVTPKQGAKGYVLVVAVPVPGGGFALLHGGVDDDPQAPDPEVLDEIVDGIRSTGTGT